MPSSALRLYILGTPALCFGEDHVRLSPSATLVCAYLALAPRDGRSRSLAAAHLFADCPDEKARRRLNTAVWRLRTEIRAHVGIDILADVSGRTVGLSQAADIDIDAAQFQALVCPVLAGRPDGMSETHAEQLEAAVALHRGQLLEGCHDEWVLAERYRIENLYMATLDYLVQYHGSRHDVAAVSKYGELALAIEPLREDIHRHLITAYGAAGRDDLAERQFERCRSQLLEQLGADPMPETLAAYSGSRPGRTRELTALDALVSELERARRDVDRLAARVDRALGQLLQLC